jgi:hypothetical protein
VDGPEPSLEDEAKFLLGDLAGERPLYETSDLVFAARQLQNALFPPNEATPSKPRNSQQADTALRLFAKAAKHLPVRSNYLPFYTDHVQRCFQEYQACLASTLTRECALHAVVCYLRVIVPLGNVMRD